MKIDEGEQLARQFHHLNEQFNKLTGENRDLHVELRTGQEKLRIFSNQTNILIQELNDHKDNVAASNAENDELKKKIQKLYQENSFLNDEKINFQENLRLSNAQQQKILNELNDYRSKIEQN